MVHLTERGRRRQALLHSSKPLAAEIVVSVGVHAHRSVHKKAGQQTFDDVCQLPCMINQRSLILRKLQLARNVRSSAISSQFDNVHSQVNIL